MNNANTNPLTPTKLLSLIIGARNDAFMGNFKWRLATTLNMLAASLERIGRLTQVEVMVCDWGSQEPLHRVITLSPGAKQITHFVVVPPALAEPLQKDSPFPIPLAQNVAVRRCQGRFIAQTDSDVLFTPMAIERLLLILEQRLQIGVDPCKSLLVASRRHVPFELAVCQPGLSEIETYLQRYGAMLAAEELIPGIGTPSALALMDRRLWQELGGYDERLIYWGWMEIDLYLRATQRYPWQDLANDGVILYHLEHYPQNKRTEQPRKTNPTRVPIDFKVNGADWGLADVALTVEPAQAAGAPVLEEQSSTWRLAQLFDKPAEQIHAMLSDDAIAWQVDHLQQKIDPRGRPASTSALEQRARAGWGYREALAWYAQQLAPLNYLEIGVGAGDACLHVAANFAPVSIFGVWVRRPGSQRWALEMPTQLSDALIRVGHKGYLRHIFMVENTPLTDLLRVQFPPPQFDLIFVHPTGQHTLPEPAALLAWLRPCGAIVWPSNDPGVELLRWHAWLPAGAMLLAGAKCLLLIAVNTKSEGK